ncbi:ATP-dependent helicase [Rufibacter sediminis]|uniref:DNA 3'-5' helicase n=1 Tax=Rufibacter sediminis TaxID=2762756 RepID=A0ABR6VTY9_9BACT|nr:ATP-dependent helicase [Rufibacter sediminis]MBC3540678.1 ATP-dependent helicase [Rufibacter sediminis]
MAVTPQQIQNAQLIQNAAAQDANQTVRLVAGPGSGKSFVIEGKVLHLLSIQNVDPKSIIAISFTRAAAKDLKDRIYSHCIKKNQANVTDIRVSTLHSLALHILRKTGNMALYPTEPVIMDNWELTEIFDAEYSCLNSSTKTRCSEIRHDHEAFWSTGNWNPPSLPAIPNPVTAHERQVFQSFYDLRTQAYACVLPGEVIRSCVDKINANLIDPVAELGVEHLIVDEVQDLNPCDFEFIDLLIQRGVKVFISGDDDQSIYSFRFAFPQGIQNFTTVYPRSTSHVLVDCFRCTTSVLSAANNLISTYPSPNRIPKNLTSVYSASNPVNNGFFAANTFTRARDEAKFIANSCLALINAGVSPNDIMVLINNKREQLPTIKAEFDLLNIDYDANKKDEFKDSFHGRFILSLLRLKENQDDYLAYRIILCAPNGIGISTSCGITDKVINNLMNYKDLFINPLPPSVFSTRETKTINKAKQNIQATSSWALTDTVNQRLADIDTLLQSNFSQTEINDWRSFYNLLPSGITLEELKNYLQTDSQEEKDNILNAVNERVNGASQQAQQVQGKVKIMSFHSSKGLSAKVVFIPGLEETLFPSRPAIQSPGLILESARLLYVAITRAKAACIVSRAESRQIHGSTVRLPASRFCQSFGVPFQRASSAGISQPEVQTILTSIANL